MAPSVNCRGTRSRPGASHALEQGRNDRSVAPSTRKEVAAKRVLLADAGGAFLSFFKFKFKFEEKAQSVSGSSWQCYGISGCRNEAPSILHLRYGHNESTMSCREFHTDGEGMTRESSLLIPLTYCRWKERSLDQTGLGCRYTGQEVVTAGLHLLR